MSDERVDALLSVDALLMKPLYVRLIFPFTSPWYGVDHFEGVRRIVADIVAATSTITAVLIERLTDESLRLALRRQRFVLENEAGPVANFQILARDDFRTYTIASNDRVSSEQAGQAGAIEECASHAFAEEWAIVEVMGHRRFGARIVELKQGDVSFWRCDIPLGRAPEAGFRTSVYAASAIFALHYCTEQAARVLGDGPTAPPVSKYDVQEMLEQEERAMMAKRRAKNRLLCDWVAFARDRAEGAMPDASLVERTCKASIRRSADLRIDPDREEEPDDQDPDDEDDF